VLQEGELSGQADSENDLEARDYVLHRTRCTQEDDQLLCEGRAGRVHQEGKVGSTLRDPDRWIRTLPQPRTIAMEATIFTGWIYDHLLPPPQFTPLSRHRLSSFCFDLHLFEKRPPVRNISSDSVSRRIGK
jgi:hypothetical protein